MGLSSAATVTESIRLCIFDLRRGQYEGQELDKILFFFPSDLPISTQLSVVGLSEGLITFTRIFSPEAACDVIEAELHSHVFYEAEPDIWMVMVIEKNIESEAIWRIDALKRVLKEIHSLFVMFQGPIRALLDKEAGGGIARSCLHSFIMDYLSALRKRSPLDLCCLDFFVGKKLQLPNFRDSLKEKGTVQMLTMGREAAIEVQSLIRVLESCAGNMSCYSMILFRNLLVSTTLSPEDSMNLFAYAVRRLSLGALSSGTSSWSYLRKGTVASQTVAPNSGTIIDHPGLNDSSLSGDHSTRVLRPLQPGKWTKGKDGFLVTDIWGTETGNSVPNTPTIWLEKIEEKMYMCPFQHRNLTIILLVPLTSNSNGGEQGISILKQQMLENASLKILRVEEKLSKGWGGENAYHVSGYRYLLVDCDRNVSRASPPAKVTTLTKESLMALNKLREEVDTEKKWGEWDGRKQEKELEISVRAKNNAWAIARVTRGKELYMVLEKANETLLYASDALEKFSNRYCNGAFSLD